MYSYCVRVYRHRDGYKYLWNVNPSETNRIHHIRVGIHNKTLSTTREKGKREKITASIDLNPNAFFYHLIPAGFTCNRSMRLIGIKLPFQSPDYNQLVKHVLYNHAWNERL